MTNEKAPPAKGRRGFAVCNGATADYPGRMYRLSVQKASVKDTTTVRPGIVPTPSAAVAACR